MPRQPRIEYAGAIYHVMSRGDRREAIYREDSDYELFIDTLGQACSRTGWKVHCYVLMRNHYHIMLETPEPNLVVGMQWLQSTYTKRFNVKHRECGHLFQGRYKSLLVEPDSDMYFLVVSSYIHLNPARAKLFDSVDGRLLDYSWSSYPYYVRSTKRPDWLTVATVLQSHGLEDNRKGRLGYERILQSRVLDILRSSNPPDSDPDWSKIRRGWLLGDGGFRDRMLDRLEELRKGVKAESFCGSEIHDHDICQADKVLEQGLYALGLCELNLKSMRKGCLEKRVLAWAIRSRTTVSNEWLSKRLFSGHPSNISNYVKSVNDDKSRTTREMMRKVLKSQD